MIVNGYIGMESWLIPLFQAEMVPAVFHGRLVAFYLTFKLARTLIMSCIGYKTASWPGDAGWKTPVMVMFAIPSLALFLTYFVPESPRWLLRKGKEEKALEVLRYLRGESSTVELEFAYLRESL